MNKNTKIVHIKVIQTYIFYGDFISYSLVIWISQYFLKISLQKLLFQHFYVIDAFPDA